MPTLAKNPRKAPAAGLSHTAPRPQAPARSDVGGKLPGDEAVELYWEERVARWLGVALKRVRALRGRALREGEHWIVHGHGQVVYSLAGVQALRDHLRSLGVLTQDGKKSAVAAPEEPAAPKGPCAREKGRVVRCWPNRRLLEVQLAEGPVRALVRDNSNFMPGMEVELTKSPAGQWQFCGRLPRRRGRW
jgi:hypothetical protein